MKVPVVTREAFQEGGICGTIDGALWPVLKIYHPQYDGSVLHLEPFRLVCPVSCDWVCPLG